MLNETYTLRNDFVIELHDEFDADVVKTIREDLETYSRLSTNILIDVKHVSFIDSSGIGAIVFLYKRMVAKGYAVYVIGLSKQPLELFQLLFLDKTIHCFADIESYLSSCVSIRAAS